MQQQQQQQQEAQQTSRSNSKSQTYLSLFSSNQISRIIGTTITTPKIHSTIYYEARAEEEEHIQQATTKKSADRHRKLNSLFSPNQIPEEMDMERWIKHYSSSHKILLVGEGDFSFSVSLAYAFGSAVNMVATSLDSREMLLSKYSMAASFNLRRLQELGCTLIHEVDVRTMAEHEHPLLAHRVFDRIVFNFPHAGFFWREHNDFQISLHQGVLNGFFRSARSLLTCNGEIHVTHKTGHPYNKWGIEDLAKDAGLQLRDKVPFSLREYPGYMNTRGDGNYSNGTFPVGVSITYKFGLTY